MAKLKTCTAVFVAVALSWLAAPYAGAAVVTIDFDDVDVHAGPVDATPYLSSYGITLTNISPRPSPAGDVLIWNWSGPDSFWIDDNILSQNTAGALPSSYTMNFSTPLLSVSFTRIATPWNLSWLPYWSATAYVGNEAVGSAGEPWYWHYVGGGTPAQTYTLSGNGITSLTMYADGWRFTGIGAPPLDDFVLTTQEIPEPATLIIWSLLASLGIGFAWWRRRKAV